MTWTLVLVALAVAYLAAAYIVGRHLVYNDIQRRPHSSVRPLADLPVSKVSFTSHDGLILNGWYVRGRGDSRGLVIMLHGWHRARNRIVEHIRLVAEAGFDVFAYDQRGHGESDTGLITFGPLEGRDLLSAVNFLRKEYNAHAEGTALMGFSLGTASVIYALDESDSDICSSVILEGVSSTSYDSGDYLLQRRYGWMLGRLVGYAVFTVGSALASGGRFRHSRAIDHVSGLRDRPKLFIRGSCDHMVSEESALNLIQQSPEPKDIWFNKEGGHTNNLEASPSEYAERVLAFLLQHVKRREEAH